MKVLVDLNSTIDHFHLTPRQQQRLINEFPQHEFIFCDNYQDLKSKLSIAQAAIVWLFPKKLFEQSPLLESIYTPAAGKDWVAVDQTGKVQTYFSQFHGEMIAESFVAMLLYFNNQLSVSIINQNSKEWDRNAYPTRRLLKNQSLLIIGYGSIGRVCRKFAEALGMSVSGVSRSLISSETFEVIRPKDLSTRIGGFDHVLNLLPGDSSTDKMIDGQLLNSMKEGSSFYNFGRGTTVDEAALVEALESGKLSFAGLDVTEVEPLPSDSPLWHMENVLLSPHSSCCYQDYLDLFIDELRDKL